MSTAFAPSALVGANPFASNTAASLVSSHVARPKVWQPRVVPCMVSEANIAVKAKKVQSVKDRLEDAQMLFSVPLDGLTVPQVLELKGTMPEGTKIGTVKNSLMRRAIADTPWVNAESLTKKSSMWFFVGEDMKGTVNAYTAFAKTAGREPDVNGGVFEGIAYDEEGIKAIAALPSKKELITKIAFSIKAVPTKVARSIKAVPTKVGRAIKLAVADGAAEADVAPPAE